MIQRQFPIEEAAQLYQITQMLKLCRIRGSIERSDVKHLTKETQTQILTTKAILAAIPIVIFEIMHINMIYISCKGV